MSQVLSPEEVEAGWVITPAIVELGATPFQVMNSDGEASEILTKAWQVDDWSSVKALRTFSPVRPSVPATKITADMVAERIRQVEVEGWSPAHDDEHTDGAMARAGATYALFAAAAIHTQATGQAPTWAPMTSPPTLWPWAGSWWKPEHGRRRNLIKAGALIIAEIERLDRASEGQA